MGTDVDRWLTMEVFRHENCTREEIHGGVDWPIEVVLASDYGALAARLAEAERLLRDWLLADDRFDLEAWVRSVRDYVEDTADNSATEETDAS